MSIELHCPQCQKLIRAPDEAGGRRGKCPYCKNSVYIPTPSDEVEEIALAPLDEDEERRAKEERRDSLRHYAAVDKAKDSKLPAGEAAASADGPPPVSPVGEVVDVAVETETYIFAMRDSKLEAAEAAATRLKRVGPRARDYVQGLLVDEMPPQYENVPAPVVQGFLKALLSRLE
jgi:phage FluMu protein Com